MASSNVAESDIRKWFKEVEHYLLTKNYFSILNDSNRVYNGDETCFQFCPKLGKVLAEKGAKNVYEIDRGQAKQNLTVMFSFAASGSLIPPMIIFPNQRLRKNISDSVPDQWGVAMSDNGWMKAEIFIDYIKNVFHKHLLETNVEFPVILFVDGHRTHLTYQLSQLCTDLKIVLIALYPNATRILQPADVSSFKPLKHFWKQGVLQWRRDNPYCTLGKQHFAPILEKAIAQLKPDVIANGFKACGIYPWEPDNIDFTKCLGTSTTGKENSASSVNVISNDFPEKVEKQHLTFEKFKELVGEAKLTELEKGIASGHNTDCGYF